MLRKSLVVIVGILLLAAFALAGSARADGTPTPEPTHFYTGGTPAVRIVSPQDGDVLNDSSVIVQVETTNWLLGEDGRHFHLYVNDQEQGMSQGNNSLVQVRDLQPGDNSLEVVLSDGQHQELNATHKIVIHYNTTDPVAEISTATSALDLSLGTLIVLVGVVVAVAAILGIGFALTRRKA